MKKCISIDKKNRNKNPNKPISPKLTSEDLKNILLKTNPYPINEEKQNKVYKIKIIISKNI